MNILDELKKKGYKIEEDPGTYIELKNEKMKVKCSYLAKFNDRILVCIEFTSPKSISAVEGFLKSYARILGAVYAIISDGEEVKVLEIPSNTEIELKSIPLAEEAYKIRYKSKLDIEKRRVVACYSSIHCKCEVER